MGITKQGNQVDIIEEKTGDQRRLVIGLGLIGLGFLLHYLAGKRKRAFMAYSGVYEESVEKGVPSPLCWPGGKSLMVSKLVDLIPAHKTYVEPFCGAAWLFFGKKLSKENVLNDLDPNLIDFYKKYREEPVDKLEKCDVWPSRDKFERLKEKKELAPCDYLYVNKRSYGCNMETYNPADEKQCTSKYCGLGNATKHQAIQKDKLKKAKLMNKDFRVPIKKYDSSTTLFYLDPPYWGTAGYRYGAGLKPSEVAEAVDKVKGKFILTYNDHPDVKEAFKDYNIKEVKTSYSMPQKSHPEVKNLIITNFKPTTAKAMRAYRRLTE